MHDLRSLSSVWLIRLYERAFSRIRRCDGYQAFGWDWPTISVTHPGLTEIMRACRTEYVRRLHS